MKKLRLKAKLTQKKLAEMAGVQYQAIYTYESNRSDPKTDVLGRIVKALGTNSGYLMGETEYTGPLSEVEEVMLGELRKREDRSKLSAAKVFLKHRNE